MNRQDVGSLISRTSHSNYDIILRQSDLRQPLPADGSSIPTEVR